MDLIRKASKINTDKMAIALGVSSKTNYLLEKDLVYLIEFHLYNKFHYRNESGDISETRQNWIRMCRE